MCGVQSAFQLHEMDKEEMYFWSHIQPAFEVLSDRNIALFCSWTVTQNNLHTFIVCTHVAQQNCIVLCYLQHYGQNVEWLLSN